MPRKTDATALVTASLANGFNEFSCGKWSRGPGNEASRLVHFLSLIPRLLGRVWE